jgi:hypothetical protein
MYRLVANMPPRHCLTTLTDRGEMEASARSIAVGRSSAPAQPPRCTYCLPRVQSEFPRGWACLDGNVERFAILSPGPDLGSRLSILGEFAFSACAFQSVCIPSSIDTISDSCFRYNRRLSRLTFDRGCRLSSLHRAALSDCSSLVSVEIPASVRSLSEDCFRCCGRLWQLAFEPRCQLSNLGAVALGVCLSLRSFWIPRSLEMIPAACFCACTNLSTVLFEPGCQLFHGLCESVHGNIRLDRTRNRFAYWTGLSAF